MQRKLGLEGLEMERRRQNAGEIQAQWRRREKAAGLVGWSGCALIGDPGKRRCGVVEKWVYFRRDPAALAPRAGAQSAEGSPRNVKNLLDCADLILSLPMSRFPRRRSRTPRWSLCTLPRCGSCRLHRLPPVRDHADRDGHNPERHQSAGRALKPFDLDGDNNESEDETAAENQQGNLRVTH